MNHSQSILVLTSMLFGTILFIVGIFKGPHLGVIHNNAYFDKTKLPDFFKFLLVVAIASVPIGYVVTKNFILILQYIGMNLLVSAIMAPKFMLYRENAKEKRDRT